MMKVLNLTTDINTGGITQYIYSVAKKLRGKGCQIWVASSGGELEGQFQRLGIETAQFNFKTKSELSPKLYFAVPQLAEFIKERRIDLIHAHTRISQVMAHCLSAKVHIPYVTTCHGYFKRRLGRRLLPAWGEKVIAISRGVQKDLENNFKVSDNQIAFVPNGIETEELEKKAALIDVSREKERLGLSGKFPIIGIVSRITKEKGVDVLVHAFQALIKKYPKAHLIVAGEGKYESKIKNLVVESGLQKQVTFFGNLEDVTLPYLLMDVFVLPATGPEGFGLVVIEAMTLKRPVIVSDIGALNSLIQEGWNGFLTPIGDAAFLAAKIDFVLSHTAETEKVVSNAYQNVQEEYTLDRMADGIHQVYENCLMGSAS